MNRQEQQEQLNAQHSIVNDRTARLKATDYVAAKIAEGAATKKEYDKELKQRQQWRADINAAQDEIARLMAEPVDDESEDMPADGMDEGKEE